MEQFTASSYQLANPPWLASLGQCSPFCFDVYDHERYGTFYVDLIYVLIFRLFFCHRWIQVDLLEMHFIHSVSSHLPYDSCKSRDMSFIEDINVDIPAKAVKIQLVMMTDFQGSTLDCECIFHVR